MKNVYFVRHGESTANAAGLGSGGESDVPLTDKGRAQAKKIADDLKARKIDLIVSSPMIRARETAEIIADGIGYDKTRILTNVDFIERGWGIYSLGPEKDYIAAVTGGKPLDNSVEPTEVMEKRILHGLDWLKDQPAENILLVSHGGVSRMLRLIHQDLPHSHMYLLDRLENASLYEFQIS